MKTLKTDLEKIIKQENKDPNGLCMEEIEALPSYTLIKTTNIIRRLIRSWEKFRDVHLFPDSGPTPHSSEYIAKYMTGPGKRRGCHARERKLNNQGKYKTKWQRIAEMDAKARGVKE